MRIWTGDLEVAGLTPARSAIFFREVDHEIFSTVILSLLLIEEGQFSGKRMCTVLVNWGLEDLKYNFICFFIKACCW